MQHRTNQHKKWAMAVWGRNNCGNMYSAAGTWAKALAGYDTGRRLR